MYQAAGKTRELLSIRTIIILLVKFVVIPKANKWLLKSQFYQ